ncbi:uncharacterized protein MELLADRAFT_87857 [Melampsora larici-populina 98AG31]|uniref:Uncharacterized protein n=1 Tax=Melampsora larici-populina (strain 98AG31 / pathotype 3-4-7) TaxID=747676 RepID=F4RPR7_MELLP|nr:uncharacterized protein MELLADRAFT_87857 [Melampsora larici-populina 98AG31]EGG05592.1 hypothetical protein MELLADRAFT_87857 [Melampsora larici-populina 98AG31]
MMTCIPHRYDKTMSCPFDPSGPGVSKQMMLDWMHIHHPKTPIRPRIDPVSLAQLVRSVQPNHFPDSASDVPAHATGSTSNIDASISTKDQPAPTTIEINSPTATSQYPKLESLRNIQDLKSFKPPTPPFFKLNTVGRQGKRVASSEVKPSPNGTELSTSSDVRGPSSKISKKKKASEVLIFQSSLYPTTSTEAAIHQIHPSSPGHSIPNTALTFADDEKDLKDLHNTLSLPALPLQRTISKLNVPKRNAIKKPPASDHIQHRTVSQKPPDSESTGIEDLIDFSDTHCMDVGNIVLGKDIPSISPTTVNGKKRSGVDVFKEERGREERICRLESSITQILQDVGQLSADVLHAKMQLEDQAQKIQMLETDNQSLKRTAQLTNTLKPKVTQLESQVDTMRRQVDIDHEEIATHSQILEKLMASDDDDDESCD